MPIYYKDDTGTVTAIAPRGMSAVKFKNAAGVVQDIWASGPLVRRVAYYRSIDPLPLGNNQMASAHIGSWALFTSGGTRTTGMGAVTAYSDALVQQIATSISPERQSAVGLSVGNYALFASGSAIGAPSPAVDRYNAALTRSAGTSLAAGKYGAAGAHVGSYGIVAGGRNASSSLGTAEYFNATATKYNATKLSLAGTGMGTATVGNYALFAGGSRENGSATAVVDTYNSGMGKGLAPDLSSARSEPRGIGFGNYALLAGGSGSNVVDVYDDALTRLTPLALNFAGSAYTIAVLDDFVMFGASSTNTDLLEVWDSTLTRVDDAFFSSNRRWAAAQTKGEYAIFAGGVSTAVVDVFTIQTGR